MYAKSLQSCLTLCNPVDCSSPGSSVQWILHTRILEKSITIGNQWISCGITPGRNLVFILIFVWSHRNGCLCNMFQCSSTLTILWIHLWNFQNALAWLRATQLNQNLVSGALACQSFQSSTRTLIISHCWLLLHCVCVHVCAEQFQSCLILCDSMDYSLPGSEVLLCGSWQQ